MRIFSSQTVFVILEKFFVIVHDNTSVFLEKAMIWVNVFIVSLNRIKDYQNACKITVFFKSGSLKYNLYTVKLPYFLYRYMSFEKCVWSHTHNQDTEQFHHLNRLPHVISPSLLAPIPGPGKH